MDIHERTKNLLKKHSLAPSKKRGQNFLVHQSTVRSIIDAAAFEACDPIVEVGVGLGALTIPLAQRVAHVIGIELDSGIIRFHEREQLLPANVTLRHDDILRVDFAELEALVRTPLKIIANLPYSISNPFIFNILENRRHIEQVVVMLQKEVADRLCAPMGSKAYGIPTILLGSCATVTSLLTLEPAEFYPKPKISSQLIRISFTKKMVPGCSFSWLRRVVRCAFAARRKTLLNNLVSCSFQDRETGTGSGFKKDMLTRHIKAAGLDPNARAENISIAQFLQLASRLENNLGR